jgi:hypothetical protein
MSTGIDELEKGVLGSLLLADTLRCLADDEGIRVVKEGVSEMPQEAKLEFSDFSPQIRTQALKMQAVYVQFFCLENAVRELIAQTLAEKHGAGWWDLKVPAKIRENVLKMKKKEEVNRYLASRSTSDIGYTFFGQLADIITACWDDFRPLFPEQTWITSRFNDLEMCRNIIMHTNVLPESEIGRIEGLVRDWLSQVG